MRPIVAWGFLPAIAILVSCREETPTRAFESDDHVLAAIVAAVAGHETGGLTAMLSELSGGPVADSLFGYRPAARALRVTSDGPLRRHTVRRNGNASSLTDVQYVVQSRHGARIARGEAVAVRALSDGVYGNGAVRIIASGDGAIALEGARSEVVRTSGEIHLAGTPSFQAAGERPFWETNVALVWKDLHIGVSDDGFPRLEGKIEVTVAANGSRGMLVRSGSLLLGGTDRGLLKVAGRQFVLDLRHARVAD